jgi:hypothetical protein
VATNLSLYLITISTQRKIEEVIEMPVTITKTKKGYQVKTPHMVHAKHTTKAKAMKQKNLLNAIEHGWKPTK